MPCERITLPDGATAIVCGPRRRAKYCACGSGKLASLECDWKVADRESGTCDAPLCADCAHVPAPHKDLCPDHAAEWKARSR